MSGKVLVSVASQGRENYNKAQLALIRSSVQFKPSGYGTSVYVKNWYGDYLIRSVDGYVDKYDGVTIRKGWPVTEKYGTSWQHADMPYQFKPFAVWEAYEAGYKQILWCDSTMRIMRNPDPLWDKCAEHGILAWNNEGHHLNDYTPDYMEDWLKNEGFRVGGDQIMACCIMFDLNHPQVLTILENWVKGSMENCFYYNESNKTNFKGSRHDQALLSHLMGHFEIPVQPYGQLAYPHHTPIEPYFVNWGVKE